MKKRSQPSDSNKITELLWVGSAEECRQCYEVHRFDWVISVDFAPDEGFTRSKKRHFQMLDLSSLRDKRKVEETRQTILTVVQLLLEITGRGETVFLHCQVGQSRSVSIAIAYVMIAFGKKSLEAQRYVFYRRRVSRVKRELLIIAEKVAAIVPLGENPTPDELLDSAEASRLIDPEDYIVAKIAGFPWTY